MGPVLNELLAWLDTRMRDYELLYLDPLVCDPSLAKSWTWGMTTLRDRATAAFLSDLGTSLKNPWKMDTATRFLDDNGLGTTVKSSRKLQLDVSSVVNKHVRSDKIKVPRNTADLLSRRDALSQIADKPKGGSVIAVDTSMYTTEGELTQSISIASRPRFNSMRQLAGGLIEFPPQLMTLGDPLVGLVADRRVTANWSASFDKVRKVGWYPKMRTVGLYCTAPNGEPYVDVIALLLRPLLSPDEMLASEQSSASKPPFVPILGKIGNSLQEDIVRFDAAKSAGKQEQLRFERYRDYLFPIYLLQLYCRLHSISAKKLEKKSIEVQKSVKAYLQLIDKVQKHLDDQGKKLAQETDIDVLLPDD